MLNLISVAAQSILEATVTRAGTITASQKREVYEVGAAFISALKAGGDELQAVKRSEIAIAYMEARTEAGLESETFNYWLKTAQVYEAMPSKAFYANLCDYFSISAIFELAPLAKSKNFNIGIASMVSQLIEEKKFKSNEVRQFVRESRKSQPKKSTKKPIKTDKNIAMVRQIAKDLLKEITPADSETKTLSLKDAIAGKGTKAQISAKLADINTILSAIAAAK